MPKQKGIYIALVYGDLKPTVTGDGFSIEPELKRDFFLTAQDIQEVFTNQKRTVAEFTFALEALQRDVKDLTDTGEPT